MRSISLASLVLTLATAAARAQPEFLDATLLGGAGDQQGRGVAVRGDRIVVAGADAVRAGGQGLVAVLVETATGVEFDWDARWPDEQSGLSGLVEEFRDVAVDDVGVLLAGRGAALTSDGVGSKEPRGVVVEYSLDGPTGPGSAGSQGMWISVLFPYSGFEELLAVAPAIVDGERVVFTGGRAQANGSYFTSVLLALDSGGEIVWRRDLSPSERGLDEQGSPTSSSTARRCTRADS